jgi:hypothetical protein
MGCVDSELGSDPDTRKSMTRYLMSLNGDDTLYVGPTLLPSGGYIDKEELPCGHPEQQRRDVVAATQGGQKEVVFVCSLKD